MNKNVPYANSIDDLGIAVVDNVTDLPFFKEALLSTEYVYSICHSGRIEALYDMSPISFQAHEIAFVVPNHSILTKKVTEDYRITIVAVKPEIYAKFTSRIENDSHFPYTQMPSFMLTDEQYKVIVSIIETMKMVLNTQAPFATVMATDLFNMLLKMTDFYRRQNVEEPEFAPSRICVKFAHLIGEDLNKQHSVTYYANKLCLSPKYFSNVIKQETGHTAKYWISRHLIVEAKRLLRTRQDLNIQQISANLGYEDQTSFCRHFKNETGMAPSEYRRLKE